MEKVYFSKNIAKDLMKLDEAVFLHNICWWVELNKSKGVNEVDDEYWTYNSDSSMSDVFGYFSPATIRRLRNNLLKNGYIKIGCHNKWKQDKTTWYTYTEKVEIIAEEGYLGSIRKSIRKNSNENLYFDESGAV